MSSSLLKERDIKRAFKHVVRVILSTSRYIRKPCTIEIGSMNKSRTLNIRLSPNKTSMPQTKMVALNDYGSQNIIMAAKAFVFELS